MLGFLRYFISTFLLVVLLAGLVWLVIWKTEDARMFSVQSNSMQPSFNKGDLIIDTRIKPSSLAPGQIVSYPSRLNAGQIVTHRIVIVDHSQNVVVTKGDNLSQTDPSVPIGSLIGKSFKVVPKLGYLFEVIHKPLGLVSLVYIPAMLISFSEIWVLAKRYNQRSYQLI